MIRAFWTTNIFLDSFLWTNECVANVTMTFIDDTTADIWIMMAIFQLKQVSKKGVFFGIERNGSKFKGQKWNWTFEKTPWNNLLEVEFLVKILYYHRIFWIELIFLIDQQTNAIFIFFAHNFVHSLFDLFDFWIEKNGGQFRFQQYCWFRFQQLIRIFSSTRSA